MRLLSTVKSLLGSSIDNPRLSSSSLNCLYSSIARLSTLRLKSYHHYVKSRLPGLYSRCLIHLEYLAIKSPSGEGKSYVLHKAGEKFPPEDVMIVAGMTDRALVLKNEIGEYESIDEKILKMDSDIDDKQNEIRTTKMRIYNRRAKIR